MSTTTTNFGLIKPGLTDSADITQMNSNWDVVDTELKKIENKSGKSTVVQDVLGASKWVGRGFKWSNELITSSDQMIELLPGKVISEAQLKALQEANIYSIRQEVGYIDLKAYGKTPTIDIPVTFVLRGDV